MDPRVEQLRPQIDEFAEQHLRVGVGQNAALPMVVMVTEL
jgi:hypothetical protein